MKEAVALKRFTTIGTGGPARWLAKPETVEELVDTLAWAAEHELPAAAVGLGSNLLVADDGFPGLVVKLSGVLAIAKTEDEVLMAGGRRAERRVPASSARRQPRRARVPVRDPRDGRRRRLDERRRVRQRRRRGADSRAGRGRLRREMAARLASSGSAIAVQA